MNIKNTSKKESISKCINLGIRKKISNQLLASGIPVRGLTIKNLAKGICLLKCLTFKDDATINTSIVWDFYAEKGQIFFLKPIKPLQNYSLRMRMNKHLCELTR